MSKPTLYREAEPWSDGAIATWVVPMEPDVQAAISYRHRYGRPKCYDGLDEDGCECRGSVMGIVEALGIGGDE